MLEHAFTTFELDIRDKVTAVLFPYDGAYAELDSTDKQRVREYINAMDNIQLLHLIGAQIQ